MGLDRFANFLSKSINTEGIEKLNIENNITQIKKLMFKKNKHFDIVNS